MTPQDLSDRVGGIWGERSPNGGALCRCGPFCQVPGLHLCNLEIEGFSPLKRFPHKDSRGSLVVCYGSKCPVAVFGVAISRLHISDYLQENVTLARPRVLSLPCVSITLEFWWRNVAEKGQGGVRCDNDRIMGVIVPPYYRVMASPDLTLLCFSYFSTLDLVRSS